MLTILAVAIKVFSSFKYLTNILKRNHTKTFDIVSSWNFVIWLCFFINHIGIFHFGEFFFKFPNVEAIVGRLQFVGWPGVQLKTRLLIGHIKDTNQTHSKSI